MCGGVNELPSPLPQRVPGCGGWGGRGSGAQGGKPKAPARTPHLGWHKPYLCTPPKGHLQGWDGTGVVRAVSVRADLNRYRLKR